ncbi:hypothetical protein BB560_003145 [Smittium megazygosporum]|uniref:Uncharacterized protein n=1 Tax=Smittium megazygosporum TaxID=133381 RepID=A0A2T9ZCS7_9FUNG|nr:hypothetical protein BB560_003145 [Smittium megazygosporum]
MNSQTTLSHPQVVSDTTYEMVDTTHLINGKEAPAPIIKNPPKIEFQNNTIKFADIYQAESEVLKISIEFFRGIPLFSLIEGIKTQLSPLGKIVELSVLEIKQGTPLSKNAIILMEAKNHEKLPAFIEINKARVILEFYNMPVICKFCKALDHSVELFLILKKKISKLNNSRYQVNDETNKKSHPQLEITRKINTNNDYGFITLDKYKESALNAINLNQIQLSSTVETAEKNIVQNCQVSSTNNKLKKSETENKLKQLNSSPSNNTNANSETILPEYQSSEDGPNTIQRHGYIRLRIILRIGLLMSLKKLTNISFT